MPACKTQKLPERLLRPKATLWSVNITVIIARLIDSKESNNPKSECDACNPQALVPPIAVLHDVCIYEWANEEAAGERHVEYHHDSSALVDEEEICD